MTNETKTNNALTEPQDIIGCEMSVLVSEQTKLSNGLISALPSTRWVECDFAFVREQIAKHCTPDQADRLISEVADPQAKIRTPQGFYHLSLPVKRGSVEVGEFCGNLRVKTSHRGEAR
jgi:hypothetical protein